MSLLKSWRIRIALLLTVVGPGFITASVDNDAGGIATYSVAGAQFGYTLLWTMIPITVALVIIQEMSSRMGAVTGKGLSDLIREEFGFRATFLLMIALVVTNFGNVVSEFAGVASSFELFGVSKYIVVPVAAFIVWGIVVHGTYSTVEKVFLSASGFYVAYIVSGVLAHPDWKAAALSTLTRPESIGFRNYGYLSMVIGLAGTTIAPWMQFYLQASIVESLDKDRVADIVEEMDPDAAADLLGDLTEAQSGEILEEMRPAERREVTQLLEFGEHTAAGRMTTEYIAVSETAVVDDAIEALKGFEGSREALATIYLTGAGQKLVGSVPLVKIAISSPAIQLSELSEPHIACAPDTPQDEVAALFDKYNLITLAVVDEHGRLAGIITADDVITMLRHR